jgi:hypothetical protein
MTDLELDSIAEGLFKYLVEQTEQPIDAIAILGITLLKVFKAGSEDLSIATFASDFSRSLVESFNVASAQGTETRQ